jgi:hypothetical protein
MKNLITMAALLLASSSAFAVSESDSWEEIKAEVKADRKLSMSYGATFLGQNMSIFDVCVDGENFVSTKKVAIKEWVRIPRNRDTNDNERDGYTQVIVGYDYLTYPMNTMTTRRECNNRDRNCRDLEVEFNQSPTKMITVKKYLKTVGSNDRDVFKTLFTKSYTAPACN